MGVCSQQKRKLFTPEFDIFEEKLQLFSELQLFRTQFRDVSEPSGSGVLGSRRRLLRLWRAWKLCTKKLQFRKKLQLFLKNIKFRCEQLPLLL